MTLGSNIGPEIDDLAIRKTRGMRDEEAAVVLDGHLRMLERQYRRSFVARGLILLEVEERVLWAKLIDSETGEPYSSFERWIVSAATYSRSDCFAALKAVKELRDIPTDQLLDTPRCNVSILQSLSTAVRKQPEVVKAAQTMSQKDFVAQIEQRWPEMHVEERRTIHLNPVKGATAIIEETIAMAMLLEDVKTREEALEAICAEYSNEHRDRYEQIRKGMA
jgi:hypothetical protein